MSRDHRTIRHSIPSLHTLILFEAAARHLNFSKAATELSITQPAVSHGIRQLELALGHPLFVREHRNLSLTTQGVRLHSAVASGFGTILETLADISGSTSRDHVVISLSTSFADSWLIPKLGDLREAYPNLFIELRSLDRDPDLATSDIDVHIRIGDGNWPGCTSLPLWPEQVTPVCSPKYLAEHGPIASIEDLLFHQLIHYVDPYRMRMGWAEWLRALGVTVPSNLPLSLQVNESLFQLRAAEVGEGIALGWRPLIDGAVRAGHLCIAYPKYCETGRQFYAVTASTGPPRRAVLQVLEWLKARAADPQENAPLPGPVGHHDRR